jgi:hypothetical protein
MTVVLAALGLRMTRPPPTTSPFQTGAPGTKAIDSSAELQQQRWQVIQRRLREGVFARVEAPEKQPSVWVTARFMTLDLRSKEALIGVVYAFYSAASGEKYPVQIFDQQTGEQIGTYSGAEHGLKLD